MTQHSEFIPIREPLRSTALRTVSIAMAPALIKGVATHTGSAFASLLFGGLWFSFGGHWAEMVWLDGIRHRLPKSPVVQMLGRITFWSVTGMVLGVPMGFTMRLLDPKLNPPTLVSMGVAIVLVEIVVHYLVLHLRERHSFYNSAGWKVSAVS